MFSLWLSLTINLFLIIWLKLENKLIFVSCGQQTDEEKDLGNAVKELIDNTPGFQAYFSESVQNLDALATNIFDGIKKCSGLIAFLHTRGKVMTSDDQCWGIRSSVWVNQEIALLAYRQYLEEFNIPILVFKDRDVKLEGAMTSLIVNPKQLEDKDKILKQIEDWIKSTDFPIGGSVDSELFQSKWEKLSEDVRIVVKVIIDEGSENVKIGVLKPTLRERYNFDKASASKAVQSAREVLRATGLANEIRDYYGDKISINSHWRGEIERAVRLWLEERGKKGEKI
jgi:hypothetical protein